jgi:hypothetical protein
VPHTLANHSDVSSRYLLLCAPAGFERHWARVAAPCRFTLLAPRAAGRCARHDDG